MFFQAVVTLADPNFQLRSRYSKQKGCARLREGRGVLLGARKRRRTNPWAAFRVGEASHPGPNQDARRQRALHALAQMGLTSEIPVVQELEPPPSPGASEADTLTDTLSATTPFASPRAPGEVAPTAPDVATPGFTPTAAPAHWHGVGPPTAAPGVRLSWLYVPLLHAAAGNLAPEADAAWRSAPGTGATWAAIVATLRDGPPVDPQLLARMAHQAAEAEVAAGEATEPELAPALARARPVAARERAIGGSALFQLRCGGVCTRSRAGSADGGLWGSPSPQCGPYSRVRSPADVGGQCPNCARSTSRPA